MANHCNCNGLDWEIDQAIRSMFTSPPLCHVSMHAAHAHVFGKAAVSDRQTGRRMETFGSANEMSVHITLCLPSNRRTIALSSHVRVRQSISCCCTSLTLSIFIFQVSFSVGQIVLRRNVLPHKVKKAKSVRAKAIRCSALCPFVICLQSGYSIT